MRLSPLAGVAVLVAVGGAAVALLLLQQSRAAEHEITKLVSAAEAALAPREPDRNELAGVLRDLERHPAAGKDPRLVRGRARVEIALGRYQDAWNTIRERAESPGAAAADLGLGMRVLMRLYGISGKPDLATTAMGMAERVYDLSGDVDALFRAWQCAVRAGLAEDRDRLAETLAREHGSTRQARLLAALRAAEEQGFRSLEELRALEREFATVPVELDLALALALIQSDERRDLDEGLDRLEQILEQVPAYVAARNGAAIAYHLTGQRERRDSHLRWLLENAPDEDPRRPRWRQMLRTDPR